MNSPYLPVPVLAAKLIAEQCSKDAVLVIALDRQHGCWHHTTYGVTAKDKEGIAALSRDPNRIRLTNSINRPQLTAHRPMPSDPPPPLRYTAEDSVSAHKHWKATCGPHAIAAACGMTLAQVRQFLPANYAGWMSPTMVEFTLYQIAQKYSIRKKLKTPDLCNGINRVQWEGSWLDEGVPPAAAYAHTHWIAHFDGWVLCTAVTEGAEWITRDTWRALLKEQRKPFHITHYYNLPRP